MGIAKTPFVPADQYMLLYYIFCNIKRLATTLISFFKGKKMNKIKWIIFYYSFGFGLIYSFISLFVCLKVETG